MFDEFKNLSIIKCKTNFEKYDSLGVIKSSSKTINKLSLFLNKEKLEGLIIVGDRYEALMASYAALIMNIKIFHLGGGEVT